jgi:hypothetical protein
MGRKPFPRNERCPCGSGDKYKRCCFLKGITYQVDDETGEVVRAVRLTREARAELDSAAAVQREKFIAKFGREPGADDLIFFDLDEDKVRADTADAMRAAGISPALIYAYEETGLIVNQENRRLIPDVDLREFDAKVREYHELGLVGVPPAESALEDSTMQCFVARLARPCRWDRVRQRLAAAANGLPSAP